MRDNINCKTGYIIFCLILLFGCESSDNSSNPGGLCTDLEKEEDPDRNPVIVIPGSLALLILNLTQERWHRGRLAVDWKTQRKLMRCAE